MVALKTWASSAARSWSGMLVGLLLAILLDQKIAAEGVLRTIYLYPMALSLHRHRHGLEVDPQPGLGLPEGHARVGWTSFGFDWLVNPSARSTHHRHRRRGRAAAS